MRYQDYIVGQIEAAAKEFFRNARAVPEDKLDWSPMDAGRSVLDQCREIAMTPTWAHDILTEKPMEWSEESIAALKELQASWTTVDACEAQFRERLETMKAAFLAFPDARLEETRFLPYDGGRQFTYIEMMDYPRWNLNYHYGQVAFIQTLLGDKEMH
jgi:hypothetical protein